MKKFGNHRKFSYIPFIGKEVKLKIKVMSKSKEENPITNRFLVLKEMYKGDSPIDIDLFDILSTSLINTLGELTTRGVIEIEGLHIDKWKDRVWNLIENAGLLPEYNDEETTEVVEILDTWYTSED